MIGKQFKLDGTVVKVLDKVRPVAQGADQYLVFDGTTKQIRIIRIDQLIHQGELVEPPTGEIDTHGISVAPRPDTAVVPKQTEVNISPEALLAPVNKVLDVLVNGGDFDTLKGIGLPKDTAELLYEFGKKKGYGATKLDILKELAEG
jgi:hypothetical protein